MCPTTYMRRSIALVALATVTACGAAKSLQRAVETLDRLATDVKLESDDWQKQLRDVEQQLGNEHQKAREFVQYLANDVTTKIWSHANCAVNQARIAVAEELKVLALYLRGKASIRSKPSPVVCDADAVRDDFNGEVLVRGYHFLDDPPSVEIPLTEGGTYVLPRSAAVVKSDYVLSLNTSVPNVKQQLPNGHQINIVWPGSSRRAWAIAIVHRTSECLRNVPGKDVCAVCEWKMTDELEFRGDPTSGVGPPVRLYTCPNMTPGAKFKVTVMPSGPMLLGGNGAASVWASGGTNHVLTTSPSTEMIVEGTVESNGLVQVGLGLDTHYRSDAFLKTPVGLRITVAAQ